MHNKEHCPICHSKKIVKRVHLFVHCSNCDLFYQNPMPPDAWLDEAVKNFDEKIAVEVDETQIGTFEQRLQDLSHHIKPGSAILDVGCGNGIFVRIAKQAGYKSEAMDKAVECIHRVQSWGVTGYTDISDISNNRYDAITLFDVIEHIKDPVSFLEILAKKVKKGGIIMITTPNAKGLISKAHPAILTSTPDQYSEHTVLFTIPSLLYLLKAVSFTPVDTQTDTMMVWFYNKNIIARKVLNKIVYLLLSPFKKYLFAKGLGDNIQIIALKG